VWGRGDCCGGGWRGEMSFGEGDLERVERGGGVNEEEGGPGDGTDAGMQD